MTQPAVSLQMHALEKSLQVKLLERVNQTLIVTEAGQALYQCALPMLNAEEEAERVLAELKGVARGRLVIGANTTGGMYLIPPLLATYKEQYPESDLLLQIAAVAIDLGLVIPELLRQGLGLAEQNLALGGRGG